MRGIFYILPFLVLAVYWFSGCRKDTGSGPDTGEGRDTLTLGGNPEILSKTATNSGNNLQIVWKSVENADEYRVYCDGNKIWNGTDTTYTIAGDSNVCKKVEVSAVKGSDERKTEIDLTPQSGTIIGLVTHDGTGNSWVKIDFTTGDISSTQHSNVNPDAPNTGWFVFYNNSGTTEFRDASATSVGRAEMEMAFTASSSGNLAPGTGNYNTVRGTFNGAYHFFWADNTSTGYGDMDNNDYFGVIKVTSLTGTGPYTANLEIYVQDKVPGLRWVKF